MNFIPFTDKARWEKHSTHARTKTGTAVHVVSNEEGTVRMWFGAGSCGTSVEVTADEARTLAAELLKAADSLVEVQA